MAATLAFQPPAPSIPSKHHTHGVQSCPACGTTFQPDSSEVEKAQRRVVELEGQMELLKEKATAAGMCCET
jgi:Fe2+ or Zn2+ uptake regulation protein